MPTKTKLEISEKEREFLLELLQEGLGALREQVYHSDTAAFKDQLKAKEHLLQGLLQRMSGKKKG